ncbi:MAG: tail fiber domain-containing protein [Bacteroidales bacterium]|nr:tail fiber domain-containing protein [Bacteroidales bacterium]
MKTTGFLLVVFFLTTSLFSQSPQAFKYQAVARDINGDLLTNQNVSFRVSILQGSPSGTAVYVETHSTTTNDYGLTGLEIGRGTLVSGVFSNINWETGSHFLQVEMDETGGTNYQLTGTSELLSVPYSLYSASAPPDNDWTVSGTKMYSAVTGNVGIGTSTPETDLNIYSDADYQGLTLQTGDNTFSQGLRFRNSGGAYSWHLYRKNAGSNTADLVFANGSSTDITTLTDRITFKNGGKVGIGTSTPAQQLSVIGRVRAASATDETEHAEIFHDGSNSFLNWAGDGNLEFRYNNSALASVYQSGNFHINADKAYMIGDYSILHNEGYANIFAGAQAGLNNTGGYATFIGANSGASGNSGNYNTFIGSRSGQMNSTGTDNTFLGVDAGRYNTTGQYNTLLGSAAGRGTTGGTGNVLVGYFAGKSNDTGNHNVMIGYYSGSETANQSGNVFIGDMAGSNEAGSDRLYIENSNSSSPLIWGDFNSDLVNINGKLGIGTSSPEQDLSVIGVVRGANSADESEYVEMSHNGNNGYLNWNGDGNFDIRCSDTTLAMVSRGDTSLYVPRANNDYGSGKSGIFGYRYGGSQIANGGSAWNETGIDAAVKGYSNYGNNYSAGIAGYSNLDFAKSAAIVGAKNDATVKGFLAYKDDSNKEWAGYFDGDIKFTGVISGDGSGLTNIPGDNDWTVSGNNIYSSLTGNVGIGTTSPDQKLSVIGRVRAANAADETEYAEIYHNGNLAFLNWAGDGNFDIRNNNYTLATVSSGDVTLYIPRVHNGLSTGNSCLYAYRTGYSGGDSWSATAIDAGIKAYCENGNWYTAGIAGFNNLYGPRTAAIMGAKNDGTVRGYLAYKDEGYVTWAGYFDGNIKVTGTITGNGSGLTNVPDDNDWTISGNNMYSAVSGNVGIGTTSPETDLTIYSNANNEGLTLQTSSNQYNQGIRFRNGGGPYTWHIYKKDQGNDNADLIFASGPNSLVSSMTNRVAFRYNGKVGIGTITPAQQLSVIGYVRAANAANEAEYSEIYHTGSNAILNWAGDGDLNIQYNNNTMATISTGNNRLYLSRPASDFGANKTCLYGYRYGGTQAANGGTSWNVTGIDAAIKGHCENGNNYTAGVAGYSYLDFPESAGVVGAISGGAARGFLAYRDATNTVWSGYFFGNVKVTGNTTISGNLGIGTASPVRPLSVVGIIRGASDAGETKYLEFSHGGSNAYINWAGAGNLDFRYNNTTLATLDQSGNLNVSGGLYVHTMPLGDKKNVQWDDVTGQFYYDNSSIRFKENICAIEDDFARLLTVTPKTYTRPGNPDVWEIGYIAEEFDAAGLDKLVWYDDSGQPEGINYDKIVLYTNENVKALAEENQALKDKLAEMESRLQILEQESAR